MLPQNSQISTLKGIHPIKLQPWAHSKHSTGERSSQPKSHLAINRSARVKSPFLLTWQRYWPRHVPRSTPKVQTYYSRISSKKPIICFFFPRSYTTLLYVLPWYDTSSSTVCFRKYQLCLVELSLSGTIWKWREADPNRFWVPLERQGVKSWI